MCSPLENPENTALLALNQELTEEIAIRKGIQAELLVFQQFTERSNDAIMILNQKGYVYYANSAAYALYGYDEQSSEMLSLHYSTYINYPSCESALRLALADIKGKQSFKTSLSCQRKDGSAFLGTVSIFALDIQAQKIALIIQDITKQYEAEQVLERLLRERIVLKQRIKALMITRQRRSKRAFLKIT